VDAREQSDIVKAGIFDAETHKDYLWHCTLTYNMSNSLIGTGCLHTRSCCEGQDGLIYKAGGIENTEKLLSATDWEAGPNSQVKTEIKAKEVLLAHAPCTQGRRSGAAGGGVPGVWMVSGVG